MTAGSAPSASGGAHPAGAATPDPSLQKRGGLIRAIAAWLAVAAVMALLAVIAPISIDEGQYAAPVALAPGAQPFVDYLYLQTPVQAELIGPLGRLFTGWAFIALRIITGLIGAGVLAFAWLAQRTAGVDRRRAALCTALLAGCYSFLFACTSVRNDALPALLATGAMALMLAALGGRLRPAAAWGAAGLCLGLAASAKLSYALPAAGAGLFALIELVRRRQTAPTLAAYGLGVIIGLIPCLLAWRAAPEAFVYGVFTFATTTPLPWRASRGQAWMVGVPANLLFTTGVLAVGPALGALVTVVGQAIRAGRAEAQDSSALLLDTLIVAGLVAAVLPTPTNFQYALPALPALFIRLGHAPPAEPRRWMSRIAVALIALGLVLSLGYHASYVLGDRRHKHDWPTLALTRQAHWIGERLRAAGASGAVASLRPEVVVDSGYRLDSRFATGPFVFRTAQTMPAAELTRLKAVGPQTLGAALDADPPAGIVVGGVPRFDPELIEAAMARGYRPEASPNGHFTLFIRPAAPAPQAPVKAGG